MKADRVLTAAHDVIRGLLGQLEETDRHDPGRRQLLDALTTELAIHTQVEDELFYPAVRAVSPLVFLAHAEHRQVDDQLAVVLRLDPSTRCFEGEIRALAAAVAHHAGEEERAMFPQAHALGDSRLEALGQQLVEREHELRRSTLTRLRISLKRETLRRV